MTAKATGPSQTLARASRGPCRSQAVDGSRKKWLRPREDHGPAQWVLHFRVALLSHTGLFSGLVAMLASSFDPLVPRQPLTSLPEAWTGSRELMVGSSSQLCVPRPHGGGSELEHLCRGSCQTLHILLHTYQHFTVWRGSRAPWSGF